MSEENGMTIDCNEVFDITVVTDFKAMVQQALGEGQSLVLEAGKVERIDAAALQLLTALFRDSDHKGISIRWNDPSEALVHAARLTGLDQVLRLQQEAGAAPRA